MTQRTIKFRAWGKNSKEFLQDSKGCGLTLKEIQNIHDIDAWEFSQFTGLHDKNGKEIYEGDILEGNPESLYPRQAIYWSKDRAEYITRIAVDELNMNIGIGLNRRSASACQVIGNLWENPDLLQREAPKA